MPARNTTAAIRATGVPTGWKQPPSRDEPPSFLFSIRIQNSQSSRNHPFRFSRTPKNLLRHYVLSTHREGELKVVLTPENTLSRVLFEQRKRKKLHRFAETRAPNTSRNEKGGRGGGRKKRSRFLLFFFFFVKQHNRTKVSEEEEEARIANRRREPMPAFLLACTLHLT